MSDNSKIEWTEATWNPVTGCSKVSEGCDHCYAETIAHRFAGTPAYPNGFAVTLRPERLDQPMRWKRPRRIFVNSMSDLFHKDVPDEYIARVFGVMAHAGHHTFQVLTKRPGRMRSLLSDPAALGALDSGMLGHWIRDGYWPLPNVHLGVSVENQRWANVRIPVLLDTPAVVRFLSCEPLLGPVDLTNWTDGHGPWNYTEYGVECLCGAAIVDNQDRCNGDRINWAIVGGESGPKARPMHPDWARALRDQCQEARVPFLLKQWGEWGLAPWRVDRADGESVEDYKVRSEATCATHAMAPWAHEHGHELYEPPHKPWSVERSDDIAPHAPLRRWGKKAAGRELDGRTWDEFPEGVA